jgi:predicted phosphoserine aminotransferase
LSQPISGAADLPRGHFFLPGPTEVHPDVLRAQLRPMISHRGAGINVLMQELQEGLEVVFCTERPVFIGTNSATGFMEAGIRNAVRRRVLCLVNGAFSKRFADIANACGLEVDVLEVPWGQAHDPDQLAEQLKKADYDCVTMVHSETSTSVLNDIEALAAAAAPFEDTLVVVDSVSGFGGAELRPDDWGLDFLLTGSQKSFALPPGLAFGVASEKMLERSKEAPNKGVYFDLLKYAASQEKLQSPSTPALSTMFALQVQLKRMIAEGNEARWARHRAMAERTWAWVEEMKAAGKGLDLLAPEGHRSPCVTAITVADGESGPAVTKGMLAKGWVIGGGYGKMKSSSFRIGHMGDHTLEELEELLVDLTEVVE